MSLSNISLFTAAYFPLKPEDGQFCVVTRSCPSVTYPLFHGQHNIPVEIELGSFKASAFSICSHSKISIPSVDELKEKISKIGLKSLEDQDIFKFSEETLSQNFSVKLNLHDHIEVIDSSNTQKSTCKKLLFINLFQKQAPWPFLAPFDPLASIKTLMTFPQSSYDKFQRAYPFGSCRLVTHKHFNKIAETFLHHYKTICQDIGLLQEKGYKLYCGSTKILLTKNAGQVALYSFFDEHLWQGTFKTVHLGLEFFQTTTPVGLSTSSHAGYSSQETALRQNDLIAPTTTKLHFSWDNAGVNYLIHGWASHGTLHSFLSRPIELRSKDFIAIEILKKLHYFHQAGSHKDLHAGNILIDQDASTSKVYLNDIGSSVLSSSLDGINVMTTSPSNLSPELMIRALVYKGFFWEQSFTMPLSHLDWQLCERFQAGRLIAQLYLGKDPYDLVVSTVPAKLKFPLIDTSFATLMAVPMLDYQLDVFIASEAEKDQLQDIFSQAFSIYYQQVLNLDLQALETLNQMSSEYFKDYGKRVLIEPFYSLEEQKVIQDIYQRAFLNMHKSYQLECLKEKIRFMILNKDCIIDLIPSGLKAGLTSRLQVIKPLLEPYHLSRPSLEFVAQTLSQIAS